MNQNDDRVNRFLNLLDEPEPPASLREQTLAMAGQAMREPARPDAWRRIWESRPLRLAWAAVVVLLLAANVFLPRHPAHQQAGGAPLQKTEIGGAAKLMRLRLSYTQMVMEPSLPTPGRPSNTRPTTRKEKSS